MDGGSMGAEDAFAAQGEGLSTLEREFSAAEGVGLKAFAAGDLSVLDALRTVAGAIWPPVAFLVLALSVDDKDIGGYLVMLTLSPFVFALLVSQRYAATRRRRGEAVVGMVLLLILSIAALRIDMSAFADPAKAQALAASGMHGSHIVGIGFLATIGILLLCLLLRLREHSARISDHGVGEAVGTDHGFGRRGVAPDAVRRAPTPWQERQDALRWRLARVRDALRDTPAIRGPRIEAGKGFEIKADATGALLDRALVAAIEDETDGPTLADLCSDLRILRARRGRGAVFSHFVAVKDEAVPDKRPRARKN